MKLSSWCWVVESTSTYSRERVAILEACFVQVREVYAHPPFPIGFLDHHHVCQPVGVIYFSDEACLLQFSNFCYCSIPFLSEHPLPLTDGWKRKRYIQPVYHDRRVDSWHVFKAPSEYVLVRSKKSHKLLANRQAGEGADPCGPI